MTAYFDDYQIFTDDNEPKPLWAIKFMNDDGSVDEKKLLEWMQEDFDHKRKVAEPRVRTYRECISLYKGVQYKSQETRAQDYRRDAGDRSLRAPKIVVNHCYEMVETKVSKRARIKPAIQVLPWNDEYHDKINAELVKEVLDAKSEEENFNDLMTKMERGALTCGEYYLSIMWNKDKGDVHPLYKKYVGEGIEIPLLQENGEPVRDDDGNIVTIKEVVKIGDIEYRLLTPEMVLPQEAKQFSESQHITICEYIHVDEAKRRYPLKADAIRESKEFLYDHQTMEEKRKKDYVLLRHFYHKPCKYLDKGIYIVACDDAILEITDYPYKHGQFPVLRLTDIEVPDEMWGRSFLMNIRQLQRHFNHLMSMQSRNAAILAHPKWVMPKGACSISSLENDITVLEYQGPVAPRIEAFNTSNQEGYLQMDRIERMIEKQSFVTGLTRGEVPPGMEAAVALQFLYENENERDNTGIQKRYRFIRDMYKMTLALMGQFYKAEDGRMIRILGQDNTYMLKSFEKADFTKAYDVVIQNASDLPDTKSGKIQSIVSLNAATQADPIFKTPQIIDMLALGNDKGFKDQATIAVKTAEYENQSILSGEMTDEPKDWEDHLTHYDIHVKALQSTEIKGAPPEIIQALCDHIQITEMLMWKRAKINPLFAQKLNMIDCFPIFFTLTEEEIMMRIQQSMMPMEPKGNPSAPNLQNFALASQPNAGMPK